jgi:hypothetical protein
MLSENTLEYSTAVQTTTPVQMGNLNSLIYISSHLTYNRSYLSSLALFILMLTYADGNKGNYLGFRNSPVHQSKVPLGLDWTGLDWTDGLVVDSTFEERIGYSCTYKNSVHWCTDRD